MPSYHLNWSLSASGISQRLLFWPKHESQKTHRTNNTVGLPAVVVLLIDHLRATGHWFTDRNADRRGNATVTLRVKRDLEIRVTLVCCVLSEVGCYLSRPKQLEPEAGDSQRISADTKPEHV